MYNICEDVNIYIYMYINKHYCVEGLRAIM